MQRLGHFLQYEAATQHAKRHISCTSFSTATVSSYADVPPLHHNVTVVFILNAIQTFPRSTRPFCPPCYRSSPHLSAESGFPPSLDSSSNAGCHTWMLSRELTSTMSPALFLSQSPRSTRHTSDHCLRAVPLRAPRSRRIYFRICEKCDG